MPAATAPLVDVFDALASLLEYPSEGAASRMDAAAAVLLADAPTIRESVDPFVRHVAATGEVALAELFTRTFDWSPTRSLEVGWHLYGEQYDRGAFLVRLRESLRAAGVEEGTELPDYLPTVLRLLPRLPDGDALPFASTSLTPSLDRMAKGFDDASNPYASVIRAVREAVAAVGTPKGGA